MISSGIGITLTPTCGQAFGHCSISKPSRRICSRGEHGYFPAQIGNSW